MHCRSLKVGNAMTKTGAASQESRDCSRKSSFVHRTHRFRGDLEPTRRGTRFRTPPGTAAGIRPSRACMIQSASSARARDAGNRKKRAVGQLRSLGVEKRCNAMILRLLAKIGRLAVWGKSEKESRSQNFFAGAIDDRPGMDTLPELRRGEASRSPRVGAALWQVKKQTNYESTVRFGLRVIYARDGLGLMWSVRAC